MSNQTRREPEDLAKKRRKYLAKTTAVKTTLAVGVVITILFGYLFALVLLGSAMACVQALTMGSATQYWWILLVALALSGAPMSFGMWLWRSSSKQMRSLAHVPPVAEQIATLPDEEILVRGSDEPAATADELLRAAQAGTVQPAKELLRPKVLQTADELHKVANRTL